MNQELMTAERLRLLRKERGLTQKQLEERTGIAQRNISSYEAGKLKPSARTLQRLAEGLHVRVEDLVGSKPADPRLALQDNELLEMFREVSQLPEQERSKLTWVISLAIRQNKMQQMMAS